MIITDGIWIALFFAASGVLGGLIGRTEKKSRNKKMEYFKNVPEINEDDILK